MSDRFSLVRWRDAKTDPPEEKGRMYQTDLGLLYLRAFAPKVEWVVLDDEGRAHVQHPRVYCEDPSPPGDDALTVDDLSRAIMACAVMETMAFWRGESVAGASWQALCRRLHRAVEESKQ